MVRKTRKHNIEGITIIIKTREANQIGFYNFACI